MAALTPVDELISRLIASAHQCLPMVITRALADAHQHVLAQDIIAPVNVPPQDNSAMDGYALWVDDYLSEGHVFTVSQTIYAGQPPQALSAGTIARIFTGASVPVGANTVVMQENVAVLADGQVRLIEPVKAGANVRPMGQDIAQGQVVLARGTRLDAAQVGLLAALGIAQVPVYASLKIAILATGDELVETGQPCLAHQIYNSNSPMLKAWLAQLGWHDVQVAQVTDDPQALRDWFQHTAPRVDVILSTGGASVGDADHLKGVLSDIGHISQWKVAIKPGKPFVWAEIGDSSHPVTVLGLPGNPQSVWITALMLALPYLKARQGQQYDVLPKPIYLPAGFSRRAQTRREYWRVQVQEGRLVLHPNQSSGVLSSAVWADGVAWAEIGCAVEEGQLLPYLPFYGVIH